MARGKSRKRTKASTEEKTNVGGFLRTFLILASAVIVLVIALTFATRGFNSIWEKVSDYFFYEGTQNQKVTDIVYFDIAIGGEQKGRVVIGLFGEVVPKTVRNFKQLVAHTRGFGYKGSRFHKISRGKYIAGGDITAGDGTGGKSIYGKRFKDENFILKHEQWIVSMRSRSPDSNNSQFNIIITDDKRISELDGVNVAFGRVIAGHKTLLIMDAQEVASTDTGRPKFEMVIRDCGVLEDSGI